MSTMCEKIMKIAKNANDAHEIIVFTDSYKVLGTLLKDNSKSEPGLLTLKDAVICDYLDYCDCDVNECNCDFDEYPRYDWLNIAESKISSFSVIPKE